MVLLNIVYGNHGAESGGGENIIAYLRACLLSTGAIVRLSYFPVPGMVNFLIDNFDNGFQDLVARTATTGTSFIVVATENIHRDGYWPGTRTPFSGEDERFQNLIRICQITSAVWCLLPEQVPQYRSVLGTNSVFHLPYGHVDGYYDFFWNDDAHRDIDFFFPVVLRHTAKRYWGA